MISRSTTPATAVMAQHRGARELGGLAPYGALVLGGVLGAWVPGVATATPLPDGVEQRTAMLRGVPVELFIRRPAGETPPRGILLVLHGQRRNAAEYLAYARDFSTRHRLLAVAPKFDRQRFPNRRYQRGGITRKGRIEPERLWTVNLVPTLLQWLRERERGLDLPAYLFGHSAGAQFLSRVAAFADLDNVRRIVIANPSSHVSADSNEPAPYGLGGVFSDAEAERRLRQYLELPITIFLGERDTGGYRLHNSPAARRQGDNRLSRGLNVYRQAAKMADLLGSPFNWRLVTAPTVGHSGAGMLNSPQAERAFGLLVSSCEASMPHTADVPGCRHACPQTSAQCQHCP
jgi:hypothetical protein